MALLTPHEALALLTQGDVIAYPTESVFGLGCDPENEAAIHRLLQLKQRSPEKGLILIADHLDLLKPYIDLSMIKEAQYQQLLTSNDRPTTWLVPKSDHVSELVSGQFKTVAIRISNHPVVMALTQAFARPIISTSANLSGASPCRDVEALHEQFGADFPIVNGSVGQWKTPSMICDLQTGQVIR